MAAGLRAVRVKAAVQDPKKEVKKAAEQGKGAVRQLLGMKGADAETNIWKIRLQLTKPVTWVPLIWGETPSFQCKVLS